MFAGPVPFVLVVLTITIILLLGCCRIGVDMRVPQEHRGVHSLCVGHRCVGARFAQLRRSGLLPELRPIEMAHYSREWVEHPFCLLSVFVFLKNTPGKSVPCSESYGWHRKL